MTSVATPRQTAADLRAELDGVTAQLDAALQHWRSLGEDPASFQQWAPVATAIANLRQRAAPLPAAIARAEQCDAALESLRRKERESYPMAVRALTDLLTSLPTRDQMRAVLQACATANAIGSALERHDARQYPPLNPLRDLRTVFAQLARDLHFVVNARAFGADSTVFARELAVLNGEPDTAAGNLTTDDEQRGDGQHAT